MRTRAMAAVLGGAAMAFALLPAQANAQTGGDAPPATATAAPDDRVAPDDRPAAQPSEPRDADPGLVPGRSAEPQPQPEQRAAADADAVIVKFRDDVVRPNSVEGERVEEIPESPYSVVDVPDGESAEDTAADIEARPDVEFAEPDGVVTAFEHPGQTAEFERIGVKEAWTRATGSTDVIVAVVDSGIDGDHPDFSGRIVAGFDWVGNDTDPEDGNVEGESGSGGHGTQSAGVIAARHGGGTGIDGVAGAGTKIMPLRVLDGRTGSLGHAAAAIRFAADNGADIVNLSLGGPGSSSAVNNAVAYAMSKGVLVIASAGNDGDFVSNSPANAPGVVGVSATDDNGDTAFFTTYGPDVDLAAPGVAVTTTDYGGGTTSVNGTSFSAPMVAGVAALLKDRHPGWAADRLIAELLLTAEDRGPTGVDDYYGYGLVDAAAALGVSGRAPFVGVAAAAADAEPNDVSTRATPAGAVNTGSISPEGDVDYWSFQSTVDEEVTITITPTGDSSGPRFDPILEVFDGANRLIAEIDNIGSGPADGIETLTVTTQPGTYRFSVQNYWGTISPGGYEATVARVATLDDPTASIGPAPFVETTTPAARATNVSRTANLTVRTHRSFDTGTIDGGTVALLDGVYGGLVPASIQGSAKTITVNPSATLDPGRPYVLIVAGVEDSVGNPMPWTTVPFSTGGSFTQPVANGTYDPVVGDFSGDGATDLLYYAPGAAADYLYLGDWSGLVDVGPFPVNGEYEPFTVDLDGNGHDDIVWYAPGATQDYIWYFDQAGWASVPTKAVGTYEPFTLDFNGDGYDDIVWYAPGPARDYIWYGKAGGGHTSVARPANGVYQPFVGDFDDDGFDDTFWYAPGAAQDYIWFGKADGFRSEAKTVNGSYRPTAGDFDGDGFGDVLFYAPGTASDFQWLFRPADESGTDYDSTQVTIDGIYEPEGGDFNGDRYDDVFLYGPGTRPDVMVLGGESGIFG